MGFKKLYKTLAISTAIIVSGAIIKRVVNKTILASVKRDSEVVDSSGLDNTRPIVINVGNTAINTVYINADDFGDILLKTWDEKSRIQVLLTEELTYLGDSFIIDTTNFLYLEDVSNKIMDLLVIYSKLHSNGSFTVQTGIEQVNLKYHNKYEEIALAAYARAQAQVKTDHVI